MSETVREQLVEALERFIEAFGAFERRQLDARGGDETYLSPSGVMIDAEVAEQARLALDRHRAEPDAADDLLAALEGLRNLVLDLEDEWLMKSDGEAPRRAYIVEDIERADKAIDKAKLPT